MFLARAASSPAMTATPGWAAELAQSVVADFLAALGPASAAAALFEQALSLSFARAGSISLPAFIAEHANAGFVGEGTPIPVHELALVSPDLLKPHKLAALAVLTREIVESSNAEALVADVLVRSAGRALDEVLFDANPADAARPAGLRNGVATVAPSAAADPEQAFTEDMGNLADSVSPVAGNGPLVFVASPGRRLKILLRARGELPGVTVLASNAVINDLLCIAPAGLVSATGAVPTIEVSKSSVVHRDMVPLPVGTAAPATSMFQMDSISVKCRWPVTWARRDPRAFAWTTPAKW